LHPIYRVCLRRAKPKGAQAHRLNAAATYQVLVEDIKALGVEQVFGLMSDDTAVFATALDSAGIRFYGARHENNAIAMAEGYAYAPAASAWR
jgi:glyoxylate carboligase